MRFLFVDRIVDLSPGEHIRGIKHITRDDAYLCPSEQGHPCFIPSLIGETLGQLAAWNVMLDNEFRLRPVAGIVASAKLHRPAYVGETLCLESFIDAVDDQAVQYHSIAQINGEPVFSIEGALGPLLPMDNFISPELIRRQFSEINRPGNWNEIIKINSSAPPPDLAAKQFHYPVRMAFDRILASNPGVEVSAEKRICRSAGYFDDHFPRQPVLPMTVLLECKLNLARDFIRQSAFSQNYQFSELRRIKMNEFVHPGDVLISQAKVKRQSDEELILSFLSTVEGKRVCVLDAVFTARG